MDPANVVVTTGSSGAFLITFLAAFNPGDVVCIASAGYPCYRNILTALGCEVVSVPVNDDFKVTAKELHRVVRRLGFWRWKKVKGLILSSPSNPTGAMLTPEELKGLCEYCDKRKITFISDEIYHHISYGKKEASALQFSDKAIVINSFSKYYSMTGWRLGWMVAPKSFVPALNRLSQNFYLNVRVLRRGLDGCVVWWGDRPTHSLTVHYIPPTPTPRRRRCRSSRPWRPSTAGRSWTSTWPSTP